MKFFLESGIPSESAAHYAVTFETNRMGLDMLLDLNKEYLRELKVTALGDIIAILKHAKTVHARKTTELAMKADPGSDSDPVPAANTASKKVKTDKSPRREVMRVKDETKVKEEVKHVPTSPGKSVFSRLGDQQGQLDGGDKVHKEGSIFQDKIYKEGTKLEEKVHKEGSIFERLGGQEGEQEASVSSTSEGVDQSFKGREAGKGILKKRGTGLGVGGGVSGIQRSKSANNIISLKKTGDSDKMKKKRISFGENEYKTLAPKEDVRSRLGCRSPPPPEVSEPVLQTQIKKIAIGGGKFEMRKVMKVVNADSKTSQELGREESKIEQKPAVVRTSSAGLFSEEADKMKKLSISVKNDRVESVEEKVKSESSQQLKRKRLAKYITMPDGRVVKEYISYDDPILKTHPIKKRRSEEPPDIKETGDVKVNKTKLGANFQVVGRRSHSPDKVTGQTLAQKASRAMNRHPEDISRPQNTFITLASRANKVNRSSHSPESSKPRMSMNDRLGNGDRTRERSVGSVDRTKERLGSMDRSGERSDSRGENRRSRDKSPVKGRLGSSGEKKVFDRLGPRD